jgi:hypothetical protein
MSGNGAKTFGTEGPVNPELHFTLSPEEFLPEADTFIALRKYFIIHGRKTGKTTFAVSYVDKINQEKRYHALYLSLKPLEGIGNLQKAMLILSSLVKESLLSSKAQALKNSAMFLPTFIPKNQISSDGSKIPDIYDYPLESPEPKESKEPNEPNESNESRDSDFSKSSLAAAASEDQGKYLAPPLRLTSALSGALKALSGMLDKGLVIFFDDADAMSHEVLISFLRQLRAGYLMRRAGAPFPRSVALLCRENIRDLRPSEGLEHDNKGARSPFNIFTKSLSLPFFKKEDISALYAKDPLMGKLNFDDAAASAVFRWTKGHPYLVNLMAGEILEASRGVESPGAKAELRVNVAARAILEKNPPLINFSL